MTKKIYLETLKVSWVTPFPTTKMIQDSSPQIIGRYSYHENTNNNGERLVNLCENWKLISAFQMSLRVPHVDQTIVQRDIQALISSKNYTILK